MENIIHNLSNEAYHNEKPYSEYLSSTQIKHYAKSPKYFKFMLDNPQEQTDAMRFGSLFHLAMELYYRHGSIDAFYDTVAIFQPPVNPKTGQSYGTTTKTYTEAYNQFLADSKGKDIATLAEVRQIEDMVGALVQPAIGDSTAIQVCKLLRWARSTELSFFYETEDGIKLKVRPDLLTSKKIVDWKTIATDSLDEETVVRQIIKYRYDVSLSMYQYVIQKITGRWLTPILVFVTKTEPYDGIVVDISKWCYTYHEDLDMVSTGVGAVEFQRLLGIHTRCTKDNRWPGAGDSLPDSDNAVLTPSVPSWFDRKYNEEYNNP